MPTYGCSLIHNRNTKIIKDTLISCNKNIFQVIGLNLDHIYPISNLMSTIPHNNMLTLRLLPHTKVNIRSTWQTINCCINIYDLCTMQFFSNFRLEVVLQMAHIFEPYLLLLRCSSSKNARYMKG
jgi:hypothetical protein